MGPSTREMLWGVHFSNTYFFMCNRIKLALTFVFSLLAFRWLFYRLAVRFFHSVLKAELKIKSLGLLSLRGISVQFVSQHTLVGELSNVSWSVYQFRTGN